MKLTQLMKLSNNALNPLKIALISSVLIVAIPTEVKAASINILNHSFEGPTAPLRSNGEFFSSLGNINNWIATSATGATGVFNPSASDANTTFDAYYDEPVPDGVQVAWSNGGTIFQQLSATLQSNTEYT